GGGSAPDSLATRLASPAASGAPGLARTTPGLPHALASLAPDLARSAPGLASGLARSAPCLTAAGLLLPSGLLCRLLLRRRLLRRAGATRARSSRGRSGGRSGLVLTHAHPHPAALGRGGGAAHSSTHAAHPVRLHLFRCSLGHRSSRSDPTEVVQQ